MKRNVFLFISLVLFVGVFIIGVSMPFSNSNSNEKETNDVVKEVDLDIAHEELRTLTTTISEILQKDYDEIGDIEADYKELITVRTSLESSESKTENIAQEIKKDVEYILKSKELKSISNIGSYEINVRNKDGQVIN